MSNGTIVFSLDQDAPYALSGGYSMSGSGEIRLDGELFDLTAGTLLFANQQDTRVATSDQSFYLGGTQGETNNLLSGSLEGSLLASHTYRFTYFALIGYREDSYGEERAAGRLSLVIVPEPATATLAGAGLVALAVGSRCRGSRRNQGQRDRVLRRQVATDKLGLLDHGLGRLLLLVGRVPVLPEDALDEDAELGACAFLERPVADRRFKRGFRAGPVGPITAKPSNPRGREVLGFPMGKPGANSSTPSP
jgi:hypothetical protein